jgi:hypothetical protein
LSTTAHAGKVGGADDVDMSSTTVKSSTTAAFLVQAAISFGVSLAACVIGIAYLPVGGWIRAFLGLALLYAVTSTFTLAKCVRDRQETATVAGRVDQARLDKLLAEHDPFKVDT